MKLFFHLFSENNELFHRYRGIDNFKKLSEIFGNKRKTRCKEGFFFCEQNKITYFAVNFNEIIIIEIGIMDCCNFNISGSFDEYSNTD